MVTAWLGTALLPTLVGAWPAGGGVVLPEGGTAAFWPATAAAADGWQTVTEDADGTSGVEPTIDQGAELRYTFTLDRPATVAVRPRWLRHGERLAATRYPARVPWFQVEQSWPMAHPDPRGASRFPRELQRRYGPDVIDALGSRLYFTAPDTGRIGVVDAATERLVGSFEVGGYPADLVADAASNRLYVADAANDRVVAFDPASGRIMAERAVPALPRSLALHQGRLYVASMAGRAVTVLTTPDLAEERRVALATVPQHLAVADGVLRVWPLPGTFEPVSFVEHPPDRLSYWPTHRFPAGFEASPTRWESLERTAKQPLNLVTAMKHPDTAHVQTPDLQLAPGKDPHTWSVRFPATAPEAQPETVDFGPLLLPGEAKPQLPPELPPTNFPGPYAGVAGKLFFAVPASGKVGVVRITGEPRLGELDLGGYPSDMASFAGLVLGRYLDCQLAFLESLPAGADYAQGREKPGSKVYVADALGDRVLLIDPGTDEVRAEIAVGREPVKLALYGLELFVACRAGREVTVIDITTDQVVRRLPLPGEPIHLEVAKLQPDYTACEFKPPVARDESPLRLIVQYEPAAFSLDLQPVAAPPLAKEDALLPARRSEVVVPGEPAKRVFVDNLHTVRFDQDRWLDVSAVTDPRRQAEPAVLRPGDEPGTLTLRVDDGPVCDWSREVWLDPDTREFLVNGSNDFARENALEFHLPAGRHELAVTAESRFARLQGCEVERRLGPLVTAELRPLPWEVHREVQRSGYAGVFAADEPPRFRLELEAGAGGPSRVEVEWSVRHPLDGEGDGARATVELSGGRGGLELAPRLTGTGLYELRARVASADGGLDLRRVFLKLPPLAHPRLLYRREQHDAIAARIAAHATLFQRYRGWLVRHAGDEGFLPPNLNGSGQDTKLALQRWRAVAAAFCDVLVPGEGQPLLDRVRPLIKGRSSGGWTPFQGDYQFGTALAMLYDLLAAVDADGAAKLHQQLDDSWRQERLLPELLASVETPLTPQTRAALAWHAAALDNYIRYFQVHAGSLGGMLWQGQRSWCACAIHSVARNWLILSNTFDDRRLLEDGPWPGFFTHLNYTLPIYDQDQVITPGGARGMNPVMDLVITSLIRHPLEQHKNDCRSLLAKLEGPMADEAAETDALLGQGAYGLVPLALALGWYDPRAPEVSFDEIPPGLYFDGEGAVAMRSQAGPDMTEVCFVSGIRDVSYRTQPNHLQVFKAGRMLLGTAAMGYDHGTPTPSWANAVVVGEEMPQDWFEATGYARMTERTVVRRADPYVLPQVVREQRLTGFVPQSYDSWFVGGHAGPGVHDLILHSHTRHPFVEQGAILAWQTRPELDYAVGDATNVWPVDQVRELFRQVVYLRPDVLVVYDRCRVAEGVPTRWLASVGPRLELGEGTFQVVNQEAWLTGRVLLPQDAQLTQNRMRTAGYEGGNLKVDQKLLAIRPASPGPEVSYLVAMRVGTGTPSAVTAERSARGGRVGVRLELDGPVEVLFDTTGRPGGQVTLGGRTIELPREVDYTLSHWAGTPLYERWVKDPAFRLFLPPADRPR